MTTRTTQPLTENRSHSSLRATKPSGPCPVVVVVDVSDEAEDQDKTPRPQHQSIGPRSSSDTLRAKPSGTVSSTASSSTAASRNNGDNTNGYSNSGSIMDTAKVFSKPTATPTVAPKFSLGSKKRRQQQLEQEQQEQLLKTKATEAMRQKHGEYQPPGQLNQGQIHTHRPQHHHDHHRLERSRSRSTHNLRHQQQYSQRNPSSVSIRIASPTPISRPTSPSSALYSPSPSPTPSSSSSTHSRHNSYDRGRHGRPSSPMRDLVHTHPHMTDLEGLDAEGMLSEHWDSSSDHDHDQDHGAAGPSNDFERDHDRHRKASLDTSSSYRTSAFSMVHFHDRPRSPSSSVASSHQSRSGYDRNRSAISIDSPHNYPSISQQIRPDSRLSSNRPDSRHHRRPSLEMQEISKAQHASWPLNHFNASTTGIVTGLAPELNMSRPHSSQSRYRPTTPNSRDPIVERYLYSRAASPTHSGYRPHSRQRQYDHPQKGSELGTSSDITESMTEAARSKAGSRAGSRAAGGAHGALSNSHPSSVAGGVDTWSVHDGTEVADDEHNYLAPLPPFQQGPAYTRVPKRKFCRCCFGGCRWWVLLLLIIIPAAVLATAAAFLLHRFRPCTAIDPNTVKPSIYPVDPASVQGIVLEYKTRTKGIINIIDSPDKNETRVLLKLQRQFHGMKGQQDLAGFQIETLPNGYLHYTLNSILTVEMPIAVPGRREIAVDALIDQQDVFIDVDESVYRNASWRFRGISDHSMLVQSLNVNALSISYTSTTPASVILRSVIVREQLSVVSVSGDIQAAVGFTTPTLPSNLTLNSTLPTSSPPTIQLNTLDGQVQLDFKAWNQSCTFHVNSPLIQVSKAGMVMLPFDRGTGTTVNTTGFVANAAYNSVSGTFWPPWAIMPANPSLNTTVPSGSMTASVLATRSMTTRVSATRTSAQVTASGTVFPAPSSTIAAPVAGPTLGAGGSSASAQLSIQANKNVIVNFP
ncbi:hypothetical protein BGZ72_011167 [Mortierella alpina]|nr:hypothetical protein BGZ72_011167 [Mortierella alpina]